jgi:hypothetical protein
MVAPVETYRNLKMVELIDRAGSAMGDLAKWPESEATRESADNLIKMLRKTFKEDSYPRGFLFMAMCQIAHDLYSNTLNRDIKQSGLRNAWMKIGELLD